MKEFRSLNAAGLAKDFDAKVHGEEPVVEISEKEDKIILSYIFPGFSTSEYTQDIDGEKKIFREIGISKVGWLAESGKPLLPSLGRFVQIPFGRKFEVSVKTSKPMQFEDVLVKPAQQELMDGVERQGLELDRKAYAQEALYPKNVVEVKGPFDIDGYYSVLVHVRPFQYNPLKKLLYGYANITVIINLKKEEKPGQRRKEETDETYPIPDPALNREGFGNLFVNPKRNLDKLGQPIRSIGPEFLIIYEDRFKDPATRLAAWKNLKDLTTEVVSISSIGNDVDKIKKYIRDRRRNILSRLRYVLLFGDFDMITPQTIDDNCTDYYYFTSRDASAGEIVLPWIAGGRIPVRTKEEGEAVVNQIIRYERNPPCDPGYYNRMTFGAFFQDDPPQDGRTDRAYMKTMEGIREHLLSCGFNIQRVYVSDNPNPQTYLDGTPVPEDVIDAIVDEGTATQLLIDATSEGQLIIGHRDHGSPEGWHMPPFEKPHLDSIRGNIPSIFFSINCQTGRFDLASPTESFAEKILRLDGAAPTLIAATRNSGTWRNDSMIKALFDGTWPGVLPTYPGSTASYAIRNHRLGDLLNYARTYLTVAHSGDDAGIKDHFEIYHVIGDPTLELWAEEPKYARISAQIIKDLFLLIQLSSCPTGGYLTIWAGGKLLKAWHPTSTQVKISFKDLKLLEHRYWRELPVRQRQVSICYYAPGYRFQELRLRP